MSECEDLKMKYLIEYSAGVKIRIVRNNVVLEEELPFRKYGGREKTLVAARKRRNEMHMERFGMPVTKGFVYVSRRTGSSDSFLPPGISLGKSKEKKITYIVSSIDKKRIRFSIKKLGLLGALRDASDLITGHTGRVIDVEDVIYQIEKHYPELVTENSKN